MARRGKIVVLDSSVAVKWFSKEPRSDEAINLMDSYVEGSIDLSVSELLFYEVANALRYKPDYDVERLRNAISQLFRLNLKVTPISEELLTRACETAYDAEVTLYDALPAALAERQKTICITADEETQYEKLHRRGYPIELL